MSKAEKELLDFCKKVSEFFDTWVVETFDDKMMEADLKHLSDESQRLIEAHDRTNK